LALLFLGLSLTSTSPVWVRADTEPTGIFRITLMVPLPNQARQAWSLLVQSNLQALGIDAQRVVLDWPTIYDRALTPASDVLGRSYDNGGFDALFLGYALGIDADPYSYYHSSQYAPIGSNYYLWNNSQNDQLTTQIKGTLDKMQRLDLVKQWQAFAYDQQSSATILYTREIVAYDYTMPNAQYVFSTYHSPYWPPIEQLSMLGGSTTGSITLAQTGPAPSEGFNPTLSSSYYDQTVYGAMFSALAQRNDTIFKNMIPQLATGWSVGSDQKTWTVSLRPGVTWHDGIPFNATDVKFTFDALQDDTLAADNEAFIKGIVGGKSDVTIVDPYTIKFTLPNPYAYFVENILTTPIIPAHVLASVPYGNWRTDPFNTGVGGGPVGTGPYKFVSYDSATETNHLTRNDNYFDFPQNGKTALQSRGAFQVKDYYVKHIPSSDNAVSALKTGTVNVLDAQYALETQTSFLASWPSNQWTSYDGFGVQELGFNMKHPIFGTGVNTPLGLSDPSKASLAAKYVRQAISYAIPRDLIIQQLLAGYGNPGITTPVVGNYRTGFAVTDGFNTALTPYSFNLTKSRQLLQAAGFFPAAPPSIWQTWGFAVTVMLLATAVTLAALYTVEVRRNRAIRSIPSTLPSSSPTLNSPKPSPSIDFESNSPFSNSGPATDSAN
jgi:ABC-type transport system substrate-binding protein